MRASRAESLIASKGRPSSLRPLQLRDRQMLVSGLFSLRQPRQTQVRGFIVFHPWHRTQWGMTGLAHPRPQHFEVGGGRCPAGRCCC